MPARIVESSVWVLVLSLCPVSAGARGAPADDDGPPPINRSGRTATLAPGPRYEANWFSRLLLGAQWRDLWTTEIEAPVLDLQTFDGGLRTQRGGGGQQTKSLRLKSGNGRTWAFRSVDKDLGRMLDPETRESVLGDIVQDTTSTVNPGGALVVAPLLEAAGVLHSTPRLAVMPDDPELGEFRPEFAGMLGLLEERIEGDVAGGEKVQDTLDLFVRLDERDSEEVDARNYLRARLIDVLVGDWDRHLDQWRWVRFEQEGRRVWRPVPRDRDQAFSRFGGVIPAVIEYYTKQVAGFGASYPPIDKLTFAGRFTDRRFLVWLDAPAWETVTGDLVSRLTDGVIADAVRRLPAAMYAKRGAELERLLRSRRDALPQVSRDFYRLLAARVDLRGAQGETLAVQGRPGGELEVASPRFRRTFHPGETDELRLYTPREGRVVNDEGSGPIKVRIIPADPRPAEPIRQRYEPFRDWGQDLLFFPQFSYDSTRGFVPGARAQWTRYGFERDPFSSQMNFAAAWATGINRPRLEATAQLRTASPATGIVYLAYSGIEVVNFYGLGNETVKDPVLSNAGFYKVRQEQLTAYPLLETSLFGPLRGHIGALVKHVSGVSSTGTAASGILGSQAMTLGSGELGVSLDTRTGVLSSIRGFRLQLIGRHTPAIFGNSDAFSKVRGEASAAVGGRVLTDVFLDLHVAGEKNWGQYPFFEAAFLGGTALPPVLNLTGATVGLPLRGYDANRFAGDAAVVGNAELRVSLGRFTALLPFRYGLLGLGDVGRVFVSSKTSSRWHSAAGGGIWLAVFASGWAFQVGSSFNAVVVRSDERTAFYLSTGFGL
jgi:hypothetical protein